MSRYLGIDYGTRRIGLAISDGLGLTARPLEVVARRALTGVVLRIADEYDIEGVVVGLPTGLSGEEGPSARAARALGEEIEEVLGVSVTYMDERFTSRIAEGALLESGMPRRDRKETVDKVAAAIILQSYLDAHRQDGNSTQRTDVERPETQ
ncbi:MAG: Holliday junction resolvase RuvX [Acidimicrobiia bacterium]